MKKRTKREKPLPPPSESRWVRLTHHAVMLGRRLCEGVLSFTAIALTILVPLVFVVALEQRLGIVNDGFMALGMLSGLLAAGLFGTIWHHRCELTWPEKLPGAIARGMIIVFIIPATIFSLLVLNVFGDHAPPEVHDVTIIHVWPEQSHGRRVEARHWLDRSSYNTAISLTLTPELYSRVQNGSRLRLTTHPGLLGFEWVSGIALPDKSLPAEAMPVNPVPPVSR